MKKLLLILSIVASAFVQAQQDQHFTMYMMNPFAINPALAGTAPYYQIRTNHRFQWVNFKDAPVTNSISAYGPDSRKTMGYGGNVYSDITGPTSRTGVNGVYAYNTNITKDIFVSGGLGLGLIQYKLDGTRINLYQSGVDNLVQDQVYSKLVPDGSMGVYVWNTEFYGGFSIQHIFNSRIKISSDDIGQNNLRMHFYWVGGYRRTLLTGRKPLWVIEPSIIIKKVVPSSWQLEFNGKVTYKKMFWGGLSYRTQDAISAIFGYTYQNKIYFAYAYDYPISDIRQYSMGSQEFSIGFNFAQLKNLKIQKGQKKK